jgi:hypothetical protein
MAGVPRSGSAFAQLDDDAAESDEIQGMVPDEEPVAGSVTLARSTQPRVRHTNGEGDEDEDTRVSSS